MTRLLTSWEVFDYTPETIKESRELNNGKVMMRGILQKADTLNQNGRIYPKDILEREVRNYQKFILENRSTGECVPPGTEIMTRDGWKNIEDIADDEVIVTLNLDTFRTEKQRITRKISLKYEGKMYRFWSSGKLQHYDMSVTANHKVLVRDVKNINDYSYKKIYASELYRKFVSGDISGISLPVYVENSNQQSRTLVMNDHANGQQMQAEEFDYKGDVFCVTVPNSTWLMRSNGKVCWTGNCDHPADSVINLKNVSHIVREARMDGNVVYGTVELLNTPAGKILQTLVESGIKLGISSRGIGSTAKKGDYYVVQDDFQLICWDFVSEPSTTQAFMMAEGKEISASSARKALTKSDRIDRIVNDILFGMKR